MNVRTTLLPVADWLITTFSRDGSRTFFDPDRFRWVGEIEAGAAQIRRELDTLLLNRETIPNVQDLQDKQKYLTQGADWKTFVLYAYGKRIEENCRRCPDTERLLRKIPGVQTALFSILAPGKHIPEHRGIYKGVLRLHLGLIVPEPASMCRIRVGPDTRSWTEGRSLVFDDRNPHEVWNESNAYRTVLLVDFVRPLPLPINLVNRAVLWIFSMTDFAKTSIRRAREIARGTQISAAGQGIEP